MKVCLSIAMIGLGGLQGAAALEEAQARQMEEWFGADPAKRGPLPDDLSNVGALSAGDAAKLRNVVWDACRKGALKLGWDAEMVFSAALEVPLK